jgi:hypothetical protein
MLKLKIGIISGIKHNKSNQINHLLIEAHELNLLENLRLISTAEPSYLKLGKVISSDNSNYNSFKFNSSWTT